MLKIIDIICLGIWNIYILVTMIIYYLSKSILLLIKLLWHGICKLITPLKKLDNPVSWIWNNIFKPLFLAISRIYSALIENINNSKIAKRCFAVFFIIILFFIIYPPSHWGPWYFYQEGEASWYGPGFYWRTKADGTTYYPWSVSAASRTLPLGSTAKVVNLTNGKTVYVTIDDRGPYAKGRILDLSYMAALKLGMKDKGVAMITIYTKKNYKKKIPK